MTTEVAAQVNGYGAHAGASEAPNHSGSSITNGSVESPTPSKDEIGWYFVEQYYTTLSKNPEKLYLFYAKRSQFVSGLEAEKAPVCVGQRAIADRIKELNIQDAKVRVTNVDSQESGRDIVAQVIGEMSNKGLPHRKFVQTFILAEQPNGYYVLNDIFRYISGDDEEDEAETEPSVEASPKSEPLASTITNDTSMQEKDVEILDAKLEETLAGPEVLPSVIAAVEKEEPAKSESLQAEKDVTEEVKPSAPSPEEAIQAIEREEEQEKVVEEKPKDPEPTPVSASPIKAAAATLVADSVPKSTTPPKPAAPKTWASIATSGKTATAASAAAATGPQTSKQTPSQPRAASKSFPPNATDVTVNAAAAITTTGLTDDAQVPPSPGGWQTAGPDNTRKQHRQQPSSLGGQIDTASAYIKNVTDKVDASILKQALGKFGKLAYFDVSRAKNCAFVEFDSQAAFQAAVSANPHIINGVEIIVAERHRPGNGFPRGGVRNGRGGMESRSNSQGGRGGFNKDSRGNFANRGGNNGNNNRGGGPPAQRGRGGGSAGVPAASG